MRNHIADLALKAQEIVERMDDFFDCLEKVHDSEGIHDHRLMNARLEIGRLWHELDKLKPPPPPSSG